MCWFLGPQCTPTRETSLAPRSWASPALSLSDAGAPPGPRRSPAGCDLGPRGAAAGAGSAGPLPVAGSWLGRPARGRGRGRSARAGSPRLPVLVPGKSSLRGLAASGSRSRGRSAFARGSAARAAPQLGAPQCRVPEPALAPAVVAPPARAAGTM